MSQLISSLRLSGNRIWEAMVKDPLQSLTRSYECFAILIGLVGILLLFDPLIWNPLCKANLRHATAFQDLRFLGEPRKGHKFGGTCLIAGGSLSGLMTARIMVDHFENIVIVEPDSHLLTERGRVSQWRQGHFFSSIICRTLERLYGDSFTEELHKLGGRLCDISDTEMVLGDSKLHPVKRLGVEMVCITRMGFERLLRCLISSIEPQVHFLHGQVTGLIPDSDGCAISAIKVAELGKEAYSLPIALFVDCTGPSAAGKRWLEHPEDFIEKASHERPVSWGPVYEWSYKPDFSYSTAIVRVPKPLEHSLPKPPRCSAEKNWNEIGIVRTVNAFPSIDRRLSYLWQSEAETFVFVSGGTSGQKPHVKDIGQFRAFSEKLEQKLFSKPLDEWFAKLLEAFERHEKAGAIDVDFKPDRIGPCFFKRYFEAIDFPSNFVAVGDAICRLNPRYGQGTSKLFMDIITLNAVLHETKPLPLEPESEMPRGTSLGAEERYSHQTHRLFPSDFPHRYFSKQQGRVIRLFDMTRADDYGSTTTVLLDKGDSHSHGWFERNYFLALSRLAVKDEVVSSLLVRFLGFDPSLAPIELYHPSLFVRALYQMIRSSLIKKKE
ncbi:hypothetical protein IE53DRAFT_126201 [Violaceomyces palustris]|uniref:Uncharacterized protein n=1 Tax=Violaceomyces palustris TaxID=1673888 RepID=A0ACD0NVF8_9BASI|nr:hypothetical protein IE53DRAFT_126201 [Violaceomyces palustris]